VDWLRRTHPDTRHLEELVTASPEPVMRGLLDRLRRSHGTPGDYLRASGLADAELAELRRILIAPR
jgi:protein-tyrosine phosphatase